MTSAASAGCHRLLREGHAVCVTDADEVVELLPGGLHVAGRASQAAGAGADDPLSALGIGAVKVHDALPLRGGLPEAEVAVRAGTSVVEARAALGILQLEQLAIRGPLGWVARRPARASDTRPVG